MIEPDPRMKTGPGSPCQFNKPSVVSVNSMATHREWEGFHFYDMLLPLFVFIASVSLAKTVARHGRNGSWLRLAGVAGCLCLLAFSSTVG